MVSFCGILQTAEFFEARGVFLMSSYNLPLTKSGWISGQTSICANLAATHANTIYEVRIAPCIGGLPLGVEDFGTPHEFRKHQKRSVAFAGDDLRFLFGAEFEFPKFMEVLSQF